MEELMHSQSQQNRKTGLFALISRKKWKIKMTFLCKTRWQLQLTISNRSRREKEPDYVVQDSSRKLELGKEFEALNKRNLHSS